MRSARPQRREARDETGEGGEGAKKRKKGENTYIKEGFETKSELTHLHLSIPQSGQKMSKRLGGIIGCKNKTSSWHVNGFPVVVTLSQQCNVGEKPAVILYT